VRSRHAGRPDAYPFPEPALVGFAGSELAYATPLRNPRL
jgi:hypothetical protein